MAMQYSSSDGYIRHTRGAVVARSRVLRLVRSTFFLCLVSATSVLAGGLPETIEKVRPSVVAVGTYQPSGRPRHQFKGTGFVVGNGHLVVTNFHVVAADLDKASQEQLGVFSGRGTTVRYHPAKLRASDTEHDLALLSIGSRLPALQLGSAKRVREGMDIAFTGFPIGMALGLYPVTHRGIVSAISPLAPPQVSSKALTAKAIRAMRDDPYDVFQLDATAYPGNSGSPLYDQATGKVVGVINSVLVKSTKEAVLQNPSGISYAIPSTLVEELLKQGKQ